nr:hypothetical protein [Tanacetum cinerariifolium]
MENLNQLAIDSESKLLSEQILWFVEREIERELRMKRILTDLYHEVTDVVKNKVEVIGIKELGETAVDSDSMEFVRILRGEDLDKAKSIMKLINDTQEHTREKYAFIAKVKLDYDEPMWAADRVVALTPGSAITILETANEFPMKGNHLTLVKGNQFNGRTITDPHKNIHELLGICNMFKYRDPENEVIRLMMFPLLLIGEAKTWLDELNEGTIETPWVTALEFINDGGEIVGGCFGDIKSYLKNGKLDKVNSIITYCTPNVIGDMSVTLKDPSSIMSCTIHHKMLLDDGYAKAIKGGSALILHNVYVFCDKSSNYYLNITIKNLVKIFQNDTVVEDVDGASCSNI